MTELPTPHTYTFEGNSTPPLMLYTDDQMRDYGRAEYLRALSDAAKVCLSDWSTGEEMSAGHMFYDAIRALGRK